MSDIIRKTAAWQRKEGQSESGGLNQAGRDSYNKQTGSSAWEERILLTMLLFQH